MNHPGLAENIAPDGGPGSDIIVVRLQPLNNSWVQDGSTGLKNHLAPRQLVCIMIFIHMMSLPGPPSGAIFSANPGWNEGLTFIVMIKT